jgi:dihydroxyacetone kinase DhaKLM complex PTS-EIIA-like component DhaM
VDFSGLVIERKSREVVWASKSYNAGDDGVFFFDLGEVKTAHRMASEMVRADLKMMVRK